MALNTRSSPRRIVHIIRSWLRQRQCSRIHSCDHAVSMLGRHAGMVYGSGNSDARFPALADTRWPCRFVHFPLSRSSSCTERSSAMFATGPPDASSGSTQHLMFHFQVSCATFYSHGGFMNLSDGVGNPNRTTLHVQTLRRHHRGVTRLSRQRRKNHKISYMSLESC